MSLASFVLTTKDGNKVCKECLLTDGNNLSSLSSSLRTLKGLANDALSEIVTKEKCTNAGGTAKAQSNSESEPSEGENYILAHNYLYLYARLQMRTTKNQIRRN